MNLGLPPETVSSLSRATVVFHHGSLFLHQCHQRRQGPSSDQLPPTTPLLDKLLSVLTTRRESTWMLQKFESSTEIDELVQDFIHGDTASVSDGSYRREVQLGSAFSSIESKTGKQFIQGGCITPGAPEEQNPYRSELAGLLGITFYCWGLCQVCTPVKGCDILIGCDGFSALRRSLASTHSQMSSRYKCFDIVAAIKGYWKALPCSAFPVYVRGHADDDTPQERLSRLELMNVDMDRRAKDVLVTAIFHNTPAPDLAYHYGMPTVSIQGTAITSELVKTIVNKLARSTALQYWFTTFDLPPRLFHDIHWAAFERAMTSLQRHQRFVISQWLCRQLLHLYRAFKRRLKKPYMACPLCGHCEENIQHFLRCRTLRRSVLLHFASLHQWMLDHDTEPDLADSINGLIIDWVKFGYIRQSTQASLPQCLLNQEEFGWFNFFQGLHHSSISIHQERYFQSINSSRTGLVWHARFIHELWKCLFRIYTERRNTLTSSRSDVEDDDEAVPFLRDAALQELHRGLRQLPTFFRSFFVHTDEAFRRMSLRDLYGWMKTIRAARERHEPDASDPEDAFSPSGHFREWLDL